MSSNRWPGRYAFYVLVALIVLKEKTIFMEGRFIIDNFVISWEGIQWDCNSE
jgi:hypothetical protein